MQFFTVVLFVFQFSPICKFGKFINYGLDVVRSERVNGVIESHHFVSRDNNVVV